ncbi:MULTISPECIES: glycoside hydrolase family 3 N-terminal domain-containing protein [Thermocrispum]|jgi:beta-N-acetylhexosaminidase|uniref:Glycoside hydrolase family 3 N-terminal domain-containing protein n=2 Tax=Thermocrispum agreste TaxID=37925 RepID=A0ABD6F9Y3_9PSEU|nr:MULTISPECIES: glycoside hydrolase family 3 N-terminal domain-containing protein [Thermocrispum]
MRSDLRELALATLFPGFIGTFEPPEWVLRLAGEGLGGVVLFGRNVDPRRGDAGVAELTGQLHAARSDLLVAIDEEGGDVTRLDAAEGSSLPGNAALGAIDDVTLTQRVAAELGERLRTCGIDVNFAPVADVDADERNPVIGVRAFGSDPELVSRHVSAWVLGQQAQGVAAAAKHFPGHGGTEEDSHLTTPVLRDSLEDVRRQALPPFRAAVKADVKLVMTAHILMPAVDPGAPATLSREIVTGLLREELGFDGVVVTDGLDMHAISRTVGHAEAAVLALQAGVDALCIGGDTVEPGRVEEMAAAIVGAVESGRLSGDRLAEAAERVRSLAQWCRNADRADESLPAASIAAKQAVRAHGDVALTDPPLVLELWEGPSVAAGNVPWGVGALLAARLPGTEVVRLTAEDCDVTQVLAAYPDRRVVICVREARRLPWQVRVVQAARAVRPDLVVVDHGIGSPPEVLGDNYVLAFGASRITAEAASRLMAG